MANSEVTLLLVGSAGNGKSATGNSILGKQAFKTTASTFSSSSEFAIAGSTFQNVKIKVVDGPGVDTDRSAEEVLNLSIENIKKGLSLCNYKFSALVILLKYGTRFTRQESEFIKMIKGILGKNVIRDFGVCIMTHGDNFEIDNEDENLSFREWCQQQEGEIKNLLQECNYRCVAFNNRTNDQRVKDSQVSELIKMVPRNMQYNEGDFKAADSDLQKLIIETKMPSILKETNDFLDGKRNIVRNIQSFLDVTKQIQSYNDVLNQVNEFEQNLSKRYHGPDNIQQPLNVLKVFKMDVNIKLKTCERNQQLQQEKAQLDSLNRPGRDSHNHLGRDPFSQATSGVIRSDDNFRYRSDEPRYNNPMIVDHRTPQQVHSGHRTPQQVQSGHRRHTTLLRKERVVVLFVVAFVVVFYFTFLSE